jgi:phenylpropionate dioxygenase-like ring-hydroxylating dioxygenase large terminal subunit
MFPKNIWYAAAFSSDLVGQGPIARTIAGKYVVLYRTESGEAVALQDRCIHRGMPLSVGGEIEGSAIRCPYHGLLFDKTGACVEVPGQDRIPPSAKIRTYPLIERDALLWIWMGDPEMADPDLAPNYEFHGANPGWAFRTATYDFEADYLLVMDNLMDLTHVGYVHKAVIGGNPTQHSEALTQVRRDNETEVVVSRQMPNSPPPLQYQRAMSFAGAIDRWQEIYFDPSRIWMWSGGTDAGTGAYDGKRDGGVQFMTFHAVTPVSEGRCTYHFSVSWNFDIGNAELGELMFQGANTTVLEDKIIIEAQAKRLVEDPDIIVDIRSDAGQLQARRVMQQIIADEASAAEAAQGQRELVN